MTRRHRIWHRLVWPVLAVAVCTGLLMALALRPAPAGTDPQIHVPQTGPQ